MENALAERDARFSASERIARIGHWERRCNSNQVFWSRQVYEIYGLDPADYTPDFDDIYSRMHPEDREQVREAARSVADTGEHYEVEHRIILPDGEIRWVHVQCEVVLDEAGRPHLYRGTIQDIHEIRKTRMELRRSEKRFSLAFEASGSGISISDSEGRFVRVNPAFCNFLGYGMEELLQLSRDDITHPEELELSRQRAQAVVDGDVRIAAREKRYVRKDGRVVWALTTTVALFDPQDDGIFVISNIQDITEIRRARESLRESEERFRSAFEASGTSMMITDREGRYLRVNPAFCSLTVYDEKELLSLKRVELAPAEDIAKIRDAYRQLFAREIPMNARETRYVHKDGRILWCVVTSVLVEGENDSEPYVINNLQDITEQKEVVEALAENQERLFRAQRIAELGDWERDVKTDQVTWSRQTPQILGLQDSESGMPYRQFLQIVHPEDRDLIESVSRRSVSGGGKLGQVYRIIRPDNGEIRYVRSEAEVDRDEQGAPLKISGTLQDVTRLRLIETAFRESEARFRGVFNAGAVGIIVTDSENRTIEVNRAFEDFIGFSSREILAMRPIDLVHEGDWEDVQAGRQALRDGREERIFTERRFVHKDGSVRWANIALSHLKTEADGSVAIIAVQDITEKKKTDAALARKTRTLDLVRDIAQASKRTMEPDSLIQYALERVCSYLDWPVGHAYLINDGGQDSIIEFSPLWHLSDPEKFAPFVEVSASVHLERGIQLPGEVFEKKGVVWRENIPRREAGNESRGTVVRQVGLKSAVGMPVLVGENVVAVLEFFADETVPFDEEIVGAMIQVSSEIGRVFERDRAEKQLIYSERQLRQIIDNTPLWIYVKDSEGHYVLVNEAVAEHFGKKASELIGKRLQDIYPFPDIVERIVETDREVIESGEARVFPDWRIMSISEDERYMRLVKMPYTLQDGEIGVLGISLDITDEKRAEAELHQAQRMDALGQMTGGVAHDFNNLLTIILGNLQLLQRQLDDPALLKLTAAAERAARRGGDVTGRLLAFARSQPLEPRPVDLAVLVRDAMPLLRNTVGPSVRLETRVGEGLRNVLADPGQIEGALINLTANSRDAMPDGGQISIVMENISVAAESPEARVLSPGEYVRLTVEDDGEGMERNVADHAFEPFFTTKSVGKGSGLGLPSVYGFAEQAGGAVTIDSDVGQGTCVSVYLPQSDEQVDETENLAVPEIKGEQETVLVVEDEEGVREYARTVLTGLNYRVIEAVDGEEAMAVLESNQPLDLLFTDVILPGEFDGGEIALAAARLRPGLKVILTSGNWDLASVTDIAEQDGVSLLSKPYTEIDVAAIFRGALRHRETALVGE